jgi:histidine kinase
MLPMPAIPGYELIELLQFDLTSSLYRAQTAQDQQPIWLKIVANHHDQAVIQLKQEWQVLQAQGQSELAPANPLKLRQLERIQNDWVLSWDAVEGAQLLRQHLEQQGCLSVSTCLKVLLPIVASLETLHQRGQMHGGIQPDSLVWNPESGQAQLINFGKRPLDPASMGLAYIAPEQTGRISQTVDYRADFYALGVTIYELLSGQVPFSEADPLAVVYAHLAKQAQPLSQCGAEIPPALALIVDKLMAKHQGDRYSSATVLWSDLQGCLENLDNPVWQQTFLPGGAQAHRLQLAQLYGRQSEQQLLREAFISLAQDAAHNSSAQRHPGLDPGSGDLQPLILLSGPAGIGKSALVGSVAPEFQPGYYSQGQFDSQHANIPYSAISQALQGLIHQLLPLPKPQLKAWQQRLSAAVGDHLSVLLDLIPALDLLLEVSSPNYQREKTGSIVQQRHQFKRGIQAFLQAFAQPDHPLVLFLDNIHWADSSSLQLIQELACPPDSQLGVQHFLLILAYRPQEMAQSLLHRRGLEQLRSRTSASQQIDLAALNPAHFQQILQDLLLSPASGDPLSITPLADLLFQKVQGNPFFLEQLLKNLQQNGVLHYEAGRWQWDLEQIRSVAVTDLDVVQLVSNNLQHLPRSSQELVVLAACLGSQFSLANLAAAAGLDLRTTDRRLQPAVELGLILPLGLLGDTTSSSDATGLEALASSLLDQLSAGRQYRFLHDRVKQTAYQLISEAQRSQLHYRIGRSLLQQLSEESLDLHLFDVVNQLNAGQRWMQEDAELPRLASLNLRAAQKALTMQALDAARDYLTLGLCMVGPEGWQRDYQVTLALHTFAAQVAYLEGSAEDLERYSQQVLDLAQTTLDRTPVYELQIFAYRSQGRITRALDVAMVALWELGVKLPRHPSRLQAWAALPQILWQLHRRTPEQLQQLPDMHQPQELATLRMLHAACVCAAGPVPRLVGPILLAVLNATLRSGNCAESSLVYQFYGTLLPWLRQPIELSARYGQLARSLVERYPARQAEISAQILPTLAVHNLYWTQPLAQCLETVQAGIQAALETGQPECLAYAKCAELHLRWMQGESLEQLDALALQASQMLQDKHQAMALPYVQFVQQVLLNLQGKSDHTCLVVGRSYNEIEELDQESKAKHYNHLFYFYTLKQQLCYLFGQYDKGLAAGFCAFKYRQSVIGQLVNLDFLFTHCLLLLAAYPQEPRHRQRRSLRQVQRYLYHLRRWSQFVPSNALHKVQLIEAEQTRVLGQGGQAVTQYERVISLALAQGFIQDAAIAAERAGELCSALGQSETAQAFLRDAYQYYGQWGAVSKQQDIVQRYAHMQIQPLLDSSLQAGSLQTSSLQTSSLQLMTPSLSRSTPSQSFDLATVLKACQALSGEIVADRLLKQFLQLTRENAGAQSSAFLIPIPTTSTEIGDEATDPAHPSQTLQPLDFPNHPVIDEHWQIAAFLDENTPLDQSQFVATAFAEFPLSILRYVERTGEALVAPDARELTQFQQDPYIRQYQPVSMLVMPIFTPGSTAQNRQWVGLLYLENNLVPGAFTRDRLEVLQVLTTQMSISLANAQFYSLLESRVQQRTQELDAKNQALEKAFHELRRTQAKLIQSEKMSGLGQMVAGIAHEINNPVTFIQGNLSHTQAYMQGLLELVDLYQQQYPETTPAIAQKMEDLELDFLRQDVAKIFQSIDHGANRIERIVRSLRNFSRLDESAKKEVDLHEGLDSTLMVLQARLGTIRVERHYGDIPLVLCYARDLNQVFLQILTNAIDALKDDPGPGKIPTITIKTQVQDQRRVVITLADNGTGMEEAIAAKVFEPFFTTKPIGQGTGLGLTLSYNVVVEQHGGQLLCHTTPGQGTTLTMILEITGCQGETGFPPRSLDI